MKWIGGLWWWQITGETIGEVRAVSGMHQRKAEMARQADAFIALPGTHSIFSSQCPMTTVLLLRLPWCRFDDDTNTWKWKLASSVQLNSLLTHSFSIF